MIKILSAQPGENAGEVAPNIPTTRSRRFPVKSMHLGVVGIPNPTLDSDGKAFDGKVYLQRVSETIQYKQRAHNQNFSDSATSNAMLRNGEWYDEDADLVVDGMTLGDLRIVLVANYEIEEDIADRIVLKYHANDKVKYIDKEGDRVPTQERLLLKGYSLAVRMEAGDELSLIHI